MKIRSYEDLNIWQKATLIVKDVSLTIRESKLKKEYILINQIQRSAISIPSNIAEGFERNTNPEFKRFLQIAKGSTGELKTQLYLAKEQGFISGKQYNNLDNKLRKLSYSIGALIKYLRKISTKQTLPTLKTLKTL